MQDAPMPRLQEFVAAQRTEKGYAPRLLDATVCEIL